MGIRHSVHSTVSVGKRQWLRVVAPPLVVGLAAMASSPAVARGALASSERAALGLAFALSLPHIAAQKSPPRNESPVVAVKDSPSAGKAEAAGSVPVAQAQGGNQVPPTGDSGAGSGATHQGGPNGPDDRNLGNGGPTGGTTPAPSGAEGALQNSTEGSGGPAGTSGTYSPGGASGDTSGSGSESNGSNQRSPAPQQ
jgi:hypothetical protein